LRILLSYPTDVGIFDIGQSVSKKYHPIFNDKILGTYSSVQEAVTNLINNKTLEVENKETKELIDVSKLEIPEDYTQWDSNY